MKFGHHRHSVVPSGLCVDSLALLMMIMTRTLTSLKGNVYLRIARSEGPGLAYGQVVVGALKPEIATIEVNTDHASKFHEGNDLGVLPIGASFGPFNDNADRNVGCVFITILDKLYKVIPIFIEQPSVLFDLCFSIRVVLVDRIPGCTSCTGDRGEDFGWDLPVAVIRVLGVDKTRRGRRIYIFCDARGDAVGILVVQLYTTDEGVLTTTPFNDVATAISFGRTLLCPPSRR